MEKKYTIGIDLGTTNSSVGIWENDQVEIIANNGGNRITPSCVAFTDNELFVGDDAIEYAEIDPKNTIFSVKRMMGKIFIDEVLQSDIKRWPFKVIEKNHGKPYVQVKYENEIKDFSPEEISAILLGNMKKIAEDYIGQTITDAVVTVPAHFNNAQRQATKEAGEIVDLNILRIVNEPTAAAIAYGFGKLKSDDNKNILIVDIGGGTLDVSLLNINNRKFEVKATSGDTHLGGEDFDNRLVDHFVNEFKEKYKVDLTTNSKAMRRLKKKSETVKRNLSSSKNVKFCIASLYNNIDFKSSITRSQFEELNMDLFERIINPIDDVIKDSGISKSDIDEIVLIGGSSRIPKIQSLISKYFDGKKLNKNINPEEAVAQGATILSAYLSGKKPDKIKDIKFQDVTSFSLGVEVNEGIMSTLINLNTPIPTEKTKIYTTMKNNQTSICCKIYEGERSLIEGNNYLGEFRLNDISPSQHGKPRIKITFNIDENGILNVSAVDCSTGKYNKIMIDYNKERLANEKKKEIINNAEKYKEEDKIEVLRIRSRYKLEIYASNLLTLLNDPNIKSKIELNDYDNLKKKVTSTIKWIKSHRNENQKKYNKIKLQLKNMADSIMKKDYKKSKDNSIGIYFGNEYTCVGIWKNDQVKIIKNNNGNDITPSYVSFTYNDLLVGDDAYNNIITYYENTIFDIQRMIGRNFNDEMLQSDIKRWPFKVIEKNNGEPYIRVNYENEIKDFSPTEISAMILSKMKEIAEDYIGQTVTDAVITVPAYFNDAQRQATKEAGIIAGLNILSIVNEPTAAAISYGFDKLKSNDNKNIIVVNLEGTFDVSLLTINDGNFEVKATSGDTHLTEEDFDNRLVVHFVNEFQEKFKIDLITDSKVKRRLKTKCEYVKCCLSSSKNVKFCIDSLYNNIDFKSSITRSQFEELNMDLFKKIIDLITNVIIDSGLSKSDIHEVILIEGSANIQKIQSMISEYFDGIKIHNEKDKYTYFGESIVKGATIISASL